MGVYFMPHFNKNDKQFFILVITFIVISGFLTLGKQLISSEHVRAEGDQSLFLPIVLNSDASTPTTTPTATSTPSPDPIHCDTPVDLLYIIDASGSMAWDFPGSTSKMDAAKDGILITNEDVANGNSESRAGFLSFTSGNWYYDNGWRLPHIFNTQPFTNDFTQLDNLIQSFQASGGTPTSGALLEVKNLLLQTAQAEKKLVIVFISDGVPTVDEDFRAYPDSYVQEIEVYDDNGSAYDPNFVATTGRSAGSYYSTEPAGFVVAETMREAQSLKTTFPDAIVHSIAVAGSGFNTEVIRYIADVGGGQSFSATNTDQLTDMLRSIHYTEANCYEPTPTPTNTPGPSPTPGSSP